MSSPIFSEDCLSAVTPGTFTNVDLPTPANNSELIETSNSSSCHLDTVPTILLPYFHWPCYFSSSNYLVLILFPKNKKLWQSPLI